MLGESGVGLLLHGEAGSSGSNLLEVSLYIVYFHIICWIILHFGGCKRFCLPLCVWPGGLWVEMEVLLCMEGVVSITEVILDGSLVSGLWEMALKSGNLALNNGSLVDRLWELVLGSGSLVGRLWGLALMGEPCGVCKHTR